MISFHPVRDSYSRSFMEKQKYTKSLTGFQEKVYPVRKAIKISSRKEKPNFSNGVYKIVKKIPRGKFLTYKKVAQRAGRSKAWRAVGNILAKNKNPDIPCHRVIRADGKIGGYNKGIKRKIVLLRKENVLIRKDKVVH